MGGTLSSQNILKQTQYENENKINQKEEDFSLSENVYTPEAIFSAWLNLSFFSVTAAMVFYGLTSGNSRNRLIVHPALIAVIAIGLILISVSYVYIGVYPYYKRMTKALDVCVLNPDCNKNNLNEIRGLRNNLTLIGVATIFIESLIAILIIWNTYKLL